MKLKSLHKNTHSKKLPSTQALEKREPSEKKKSTGLWKLKTSKKKKEQKMKMGKEYLETNCGE